MLTNAERVRLAIACEDSKITDQESADKGHQIDRLSAPEILEKLRTGVTMLFSRERMESILTDLERLEQIDAKAKNMLELIHLLNLTATP